MSSEKKDIILERLNQFGVSKTKWQIFLASERIPLQHFPISRHRLD